MAHYHYDKDGNYIGKSTNTLDEILKGLGKAFGYYVIAAIVVAFWAILGEIISSKYNLEEGSGMTIMGVGIILTIVVVSIIAFVKWIKSIKNYGWKGSYSNLSPFFQLFLIIGFVLLFIVLFSIFYAVYLELHS